MLRIIRTGADHPAFLHLVVLLDRELLERNGETHAFFAPYNTLNTIRHAVVAYVEDMPVGCGAIKEYNQETAEVKRMFVRPEFRSRGIAGNILSELERWAIDLGYRSCILETGKKQPEAIRCYQRSGYETMPNYGPYQNVESSVCMKKLLVQTAEDCPKG